MAYAEAALGALRGLAGMDWLTARSGSRGRKISLLAELGRRVQAGDAIVELAGQICIRRKSVKSELAELRATRLDRPVQFGGLVDRGLRKQLADIVLALVEVKPEELHRDLAGIIEVKRRGLTDRLERLFRLVGELQRVG